ncbi:Testis-expressed sequence 13A protein [Fukomys damarensis]|uniref:Testis-expressed sequence 13A protein n=1 Tax=Fukomys damarensis TaxID=885580 RepID=A0A091E5U0_FUKDA|nr:Testis-expressed sequence 13A protein [Fukomys damarensis]
MAVDVRDPVSGFRHVDVIQFINSEIRRNGGGPDFYLAFRSLSWNEVEDGLHTVLADHQIPRTLKRACTLSALALGVRVIARQQEQQAHRLHWLWAQLKERKATCRALALETQQMRQERDHATAQLHFMRASLQQVTATEICPPSSSAAVGSQEDINQSCHPLDNPQNLQDGCHLGDSSSHSQKGTRAPRRRGTSWAPPSAPLAGTSAGGSCGVGRPGPPSSRSTVVVGAEVIGCVARVGELREVHAERFARAHAGVRMGWPQGQRSPRVPNRLFKMRLDSRGGHAEGVGIREEDDLKAGACVTGNCSRLPMPEDSCMASQTTRRSCSHKSCSLRYWNSRYAYSGRSSCG